MSDYAAFAAYYDRFTSNVDYGARARYFDTVIQKYTPDANLLLDLACGTGSLTFELEALGYDVIGVDDSAEMLSAAVEKRAQKGSGALFLCQSMAELDLFGTIDVTVCALDSLNHVLDEGELERIFKRVSLFSNPGALFVFDVNTPYKHSELLADNCFVYEDEGAFCAWQNQYEAETGIVDMKLDFFELDPACGEWKRSASEFSERAYPMEFFTGLAAKSGFEQLALFDEDSFLPLRKDSSRAVFVMKKR